MAKNIDIILQENNMAIGQFAYFGRQETASDLNGKKLTSIAKSIGTEFGHKAKKSFVNMVAALYLERDLRAETFVFALSDLPANDWKVELKEVTEKANPALTSQFMRDMIALDFLDNNKSVIEPAYKDRIAAKVNETAYRR